MARLETKQRLSGRAQRDSLPPGFLLRENFVSVKSEERYLRLFAQLPFEPTWMRGKMLRRNILAFGLALGPNFQSVESAKPLPSYLLELRALAATLAGESATAFEQAFIQRYTSGATIGFHTDARIFGTPIIGISFGGTARMRFRSPDVGESECILRSRSAYCLSSDARHVWRHAVDAIKITRYSVTFRKILR